jgi:hypothetical protein
MCPDEIVTPTVTPPPATVTVTPPPTTTINPADHQRAIDDMLKHKTRAAELEQQLKAASDAKLKESNDYKTLSEQRETEVATLKAENKRIQDAIVEEKRTTALKSKLTSMGLQIRPEAESDLEALDLSGLRIETTSTGKINVLGVGEFAERLKAAKPHYFADKVAPNVNTTGARVLDSGGVITPQDLIAAEREGRKTKNMGPYQELMKKYQQQRVAGRG